MAKLPNILSKLFTSGISFSAGEEQGIQRTFTYFTSLFWGFVAIFGIWCVAAGVDRWATSGAVAAIVTFLAAISTCLALAAAASVVGGLFGFLFGIPKTNQNQVDHSAQGRWRSDTNLEEISDWLTKILVGVGLAQISQIHGAFSGLQEFMINENVFPQNAGGRIIVPLIVVTYLVTGFLFGYLLTRMFLAPVLAQQDLRLNSPQVVSSEDEASQKIINYLWRDGRRTDQEGRAILPIPENLEKLRKWMSENHLEEQSIQKFLDSPMFKGAREASIQEIPITGGH